MLVYATAADLVDGDWVETAPDNATALLREASAIVRRATRAALYDVDGAGKPQDPETLAAFTDATCAQVAYWVDNEIEPSAASLGAGQPIVASKSMGDRSISYAVDQATVLARSQAGSQLCQLAWDLLQEAELVNGQPMAQGRSYVY